MKTMRKIVTTSLLCGAAAAALPQAAAAQRIDRIYAFGDSYADDGNAFELGGINPLSTQVYPTGRFSGGTNYIDTLSQLLYAQVFNFAIGGAQANGANVNAGLPGFGFEVQSFLAGGNLGIPGVPNAFPSVTPSFGPTDLVAVSIGGNDARSFQLNGGTMATLDQSVAVSVAGAQAGLDALVGAGARNISFLAGDTAQLPEVAVQPDPTGAAAIRSAFSTSYNDQLREILGGYAQRNGVMVHYLDLAILGPQIANNLEAYGFTSEACAFFNPARPSTLACAIDSDVAASNVFYGDGVHLTSAGFDVIGRYVAAQLQAPLVLDQPRQTAIDNGHAFANVLTARMDGGAPRDGGYAGGLDIFLSGDTIQRTTEIRIDSESYQNHHYGITAGLEYGFGLGTIGIAGRYGFTDSDAVNNAQFIEGNSYAGALYAALGLGPVFAQGYVGLGRDDMELTRAGVIDEFTMTADIDGDSFVAGGKLGYLANLGALRVGPVAGVDHVTVDLDPYRESGDPVLNLQVGEQDIRSTRGYVGVEARGDALTGGIQVRPHAGVFLEQQFAGDADTVGFSQVNAPEIVNSWRSGELDDDPYARVRVGMSAQLAPMLRLDVSGTTTMRKNDGDETAGTLGLSLDF